MFLQFVDCSCSGCENRSTTSTQILGSPRSTISFVLPTGKRCGYNTRGKPQIQQIAGFELPGAAYGFCNPC